MCTNIAAAGGSCQVLLTGGAHRINIGAVYKIPPSAPAAAIVADIRDAAQDADVSWWVAPGNQHYDPCTFCSSDPQPAACIVYGDRGSHDCCRACIGAAVEYIDTPGERVTVDVALRPSEVDTAR